MSWSRSRSEPEIKDLGTSWSRENFGRSRYRLGPQRIVNIPPHGTRRTPTATLNRNYTRLQHCSSVQGQRSRR